MWLRRNDVGPVEWRNSPERRIETPSIQVHNKAELISCMLSQHASPNEWQQFNSNLSNALSHVGSQAIIWNKIGLVHRWPQQIKQISHLQVDLGYDDAIKHFPRYWPFVRGIQQSPEDSPHKGQWRGAVMFSSYIPGKTVEQTIDTSVFWDAITLIMTSL